MDDDYMSEERDWRDYSAGVQVGEQIGENLDLESIHAIIAHAEPGWWAIGMHDGVHSAIKRKASREQ